MNKLWAPWRIRYITQTHKKRCIFCTARTHTHNHSVVFRTPYNLVMLNTFPYNNGHCMVCPKRHLKRIAQLTQKEILDLFSAIATTQRLLKEILKPEGFNIGINEGKCAGAGILGHLHVHIVPRWTGDTNFMPSIFGTKVISQSLNQLHTQLTDAYAKTYKRTRK